MFRPSNGGSSSGGTRRESLQPRHRYGWAESATDWRSVIARDDIQIVDICAPGFMHAEIATAALAAGKHVLVEKPLANTVAEAEAMAAAASDAQSRGVQSMIGFNYRRVPALALARELISEGRLGAVKQFRAAYLQDWLVDPETPMTWRLRKDTAGSGALGDIASHAIDQVLFLLGRPGHRGFRPAAHVHPGPARRPRTRKSDGRRRRLGDADACVRGHRLD